MRDRDIRPTLKAHIRSELDDPAVFDEMPLCRTAKADVVAVNGSMWGFEIKSERDSLARLPLQIPYYDAIFDYSVAVVASRHVANVRAGVPRHWGIIMATADGAGVDLTHVRKPRKNTKTDVASIIRLLWKPEVVRVLKRFGCKASPNESVADLWARLELFSRKEVVAAALKCLKARAAMPPAQKLAQGDDSSPTEATASPLLASG